jgi:CTP synthase (UTP-ammonia lyase)
LRDGLSRNVVVEHDFLSCDAGRQNAMQTIHIGLIGDFNPDVIAHRAIPRALALASEAEECEAELVWLATDTIRVGDREQFARFDGLWCVPASPYASLDGALWAIRFARESNLPFLGTCGGFQHALIEFARNVAGLSGADHAESNPKAELKLVAPLACSLVEQSGEIQLETGSFIRAICGSETLTETYHCRYGLNPKFRQAVECDGLRFVGFDAAGEARVLELQGHPFFVATLFQPERSALQEKTHPLIRAFAQACARAHPAQLV